jgi:hypothetical protein
VTGNGDDDYQVVWGLVPDEAVLIGMPPDMTPDAFEQQALAQVDDLHSFRANLVRGLARHARYMGFERMGRIHPFTSTTVAPKLALLGAIEHEDEVDPRLYEAIEADITTEE